MNSSIYLLVYEIKGKNIVVDRSMNYAYIKRKKDLCDSRFNKEGQIKKLRKS